MSQQSTAECISSGYSISMARSNSRSAIIKYPHPLPVINSCCITSEIPSYANLSTGKKTASQESIISANWHSSCIK